MSRYDATPMPLLSSDRERRLWGWTLAVVVAIFIYEALTERASQGRRVPVPELLAVVAASLVGVFDECIQKILPGRVFDPVDMLFNSGAAVMAVVASVALGWARRHTIRMLNFGSRSG